MIYSLEFEQAWKAYREGLSPKEKNRCGKAESNRVWIRLGLDKDLDAVLAWIKTLPETYSPGYRPSMAKWIKHQDFKANPATATPAPRQEPIVYDGVEAAIEKFGRYRAAQAAKAPGIHARAKELWEQRPWESYYKCFKQAEREAEVSKG